MKLVRMLWLMMIVMLIPSLLAAQSKKPVAKTSAELKEDCAKFVQGFYDWYIPKASADINKQGSSAASLALKKRPEDISRALKYALTQDASAQSKSTEVVGLDGDPFLNCQDCPLHVKYGDPRLTGYRCQVPIYFVQDGKAEDDPHVIPEVMYTQKRWIIMNILDGDGKGDLLTTLKELKKGNAP